MTANPESLRDQNQRLRTIKITGLMHSEESIRDVIRQLHETAKACDSSCHEVAAMMLHRLVLRNHELSDRLKKIAADASNEGGF